jgi:hypothetical protein
MALWAWHEDLPEPSSGSGAPWPTARRSHGACLLESGSMLVFGGYANDVSIFKDTWLLPPPADHVARSAMEASSSPIAEHAVAVRACTAQPATECPCKRHDHCVVAYSSSTHSACRAFLFGGYTSLARGEGERALGDFWELDRDRIPTSSSVSLSPFSLSPSSRQPEVTTPPAEWRWQKVHERSNGHPRSRANASLTACPNAGVLALFGGYSGWQEPRTMFSDLWLYDCEGSAGWINVRPLFNLCGVLIVGVLLPRLC